MSELQNDTKKSRAEIRRNRIAEGVIEGKTEQQMANELDMSRVQVARTKADPRVQKIITQRLKDAASLTAEEIIGTLASQMRADATELFTAAGGFDLKAIRRKRLGHLVKRIKVRREIEGKGDDATPVDVIEIELHSSQAAAIQLSKIAGLEKLPAPNDADRWQEIARSLSERFNVPIEQVKRDLAKRKPELASVLVM